MSTYKHSRWTRKMKRWLVADRRSNNGTGKGRDKTLRVRDRRQLDQVDGRGWPTFPQSDR